MNPVVIAHFLAALVVIISSIPLMRRRVKMNDWYGFRIPASFASDEAWFDINCYGGRLFLVWGVSIALTAGVGALLEKRHWLTYNWTAVAVILGGLGLAVAMTFRYARNRRPAKSDQPASP